MMFDAQQKWAVRLKELERQNEELEKENQELRKTVESLSSPSSSDSSNTVNSQRGLLTHLLHKAKKNPKFWILIVLIVIFVWLKRRNCQLIRFVGL